MGGFGSGVGFGRREFLRGAAVAPLAWGVAGLVGGQDAVPGADGRFPGLVTRQRKPDTAGSAQVNREVDGGGDYAERAQSWTVGYGLTDRVGAYTEWFVLFPQGATEARAEH